MRKWGTVSTSRGPLVPLIDDYRSGGMIVYNIVASNQYEEPVLNCYHDELYNVLKGWGKMVMQRLIITWRFDGVCNSFCEILGY